MGAAPIHAEQAALLAAICAEPDEDTPRLVYADWLQENGDEEQAQYIRGSVACARFEPLSEEATSARQALHNVEYRRRSDWLEALGIPRDLTPTLEFHFHRGFVEHLVCTHAATLRKWAAAVFRALPVQRLYLGSYYDNNRTDADDLLRLAAMPELGRVRDLELGGFKPAGEAPWDAVFRSPHLRGLRTLRFGGGFDAFRRAPVLPRLTTLVMGDAHDAGELRRLLDSPQCAGLTRLLFHRVSRPFLPPGAGLHRLLTGPLPPRVRVLGVGDLDEDLAGVLVRSSHLDGLTELWAGWHEQRNAPRPEWFTAFLDRFGLIWRNHPGYSYDWLRPAPDWRYTP